MQEEYIEKIEAPQPPALIKTPVPEEAVNEVPEPFKKRDSMADLFEVPQPEDNDMYVDDLVATPEEDDISDLVDVSNEDIMGEPPPLNKEREYKMPSRRVRRTSRPYNPPTSLGGMR